MKFRTLLSIAQLWFLISAPLQAETKLASVFSDHMVLQRDKPVPVWGKASPGEAMTVSFAGQEIGVEAGADGRWSVELEPLAASAEGRDLVVKAASGEAKLTIRDVLVGEVWLCSGQSNMEWSVSASNDAEGEIAAANYPSIRLLHVPRFPATWPQDEVKAAWKVCSPENVSGFSAVGYYFGRELSRELDVPIGLIASAWGGTRIEPWTPVVGLESVESTKSLAASFGDPQVTYQAKLKEHIPVLEAWVEQAKQAQASDSALPELPTAPAPPKYGSGTPTGLYNGMIHPLIPFAMRGAIWYQGESNNGEGMAYFDKMRALINGWRSVFENPDLSFYFVQLAPFNYANGQLTLPYIWEAQAAAALKVPNTGMAVTTDVGNIKDIHPRNKQDVGKRLALWALAKNYGRVDVVYSGPIYRSMVVEGNQIRVNFDHAAGGLKSRDDQALSDFQIAGEDGNFVPAAAQIDGETVLVSADGVVDPKHVRFAWHHQVNPNLCNQAGLPASPFKSDRWLLGK
ncbi:MAG: sialate O-acetylesterase [Verrucomicrobiales bacterium]